MKKFVIHNLKSAPGGSKDALAATQKNAGFIPNLHGILAESPVLLNAY